MTSEDGKIMLQPRTSEDGEFNMYLTNFGPRIYFTDGKRGKLSKFVVESGLTNEAAPIDCN